MPKVKEFEAQNLSRASSERKVFTASRFPLNEMFFFLNEIVAMSLRSSDCINFKKFPAKVNLTGQTVN